MRRVDSSKALPHNYTIHYLTSEDGANEAMAQIVDGAVGFDTEFMVRQPSEEEGILNELFGTSSGNKKAALLGWQMIELSKDRNHEIQWDLAGLCVVQIARDDVAWVINVSSMRGKSLEKHVIFTHRHPQRFPRNSSGY